MSKLAHSSTMFEDSILSQYCTKQGIPCPNRDDERYDVLMEDAIQWHEDDCQFGAGA